MCYNIKTSYMDLRYDTYIQSCPYTMCFSPVQAPQVDSTNLFPLEMNITSREHPNSIGMMDITENT